MHFNLLNKSNHHPKEIIKSVEEIGQRVIILQTLYERFIEDSTIGMYVLDGDRFIFTNSRLCEIIGYTEEELLSGNIRLKRIVLDEDFPIVQEKIDERMKRLANEVRYQVRIVTKEGHIRFVDVYGSVAKFDGKDMIFGTLGDITEFVQSNKRLKEREKQFLSLFENSTDAVYALDLNGKFLALNRMCYEISGYEEAELKNTSFMPLVISEELPKILINFNRAKKGELTTYNVTIRHKLGYKVSLQVSNFPMIEDGKIIGVYGIAKDVTNSQRYKQEINRLAYYDRLTNLPNRSLFIERIKDYLANDKDFAVLLLDIDGFKFINDTFGHTSGDEFLREVGNRLLECLPPHNTLARLGGDEFAIAIQNLNTTSIKNISDSVVNALKEPFYINQKKVNITASIGIVQNTSVQDGPEDLLRKAGIAMFYAKEQGKNQYFVYDQEFDQLFKYRYIIANGLKDAVDQDQFSLKFQPIVNLSTGQVDLIELLIRWNHPEHGFISPADFIPIAEENGTIMEIGYWVLKSACLELLKWNSEGENAVKLAINISTKQLQHPEFIDEVRKIIQEFQIDPTWIEFEITESKLLENELEIKKRLRQLKNLGVSLSIDDFGTGYTSLIQLQQFSFDTLKIDRSFIQDMDGTNGKAITSAIISLAHHLGITVVAEGIEKESQLNYLKEINCDRVQGFYLSKPTTIEQVKRFIQKEKIV
ncbi:EAL and GGDEF domain-containing protein [Bacillus kexueae]|uniref:sensor domain-containing protein n=1 Tax=Aeribacillus kexueae TaxID=2078952 RepID=UPI001FAF6DE5|nr:bifunctional diguanylate cyclase/phosphodiesterase [Bacillus kexueae]